MTAEHINDNLDALAAVEQSDRIVSAATRVIASLRARLRTARRERDNARAVARVLAHAYETGNRPPPAVVTDALNTHVSSAELIRGLRLIQRSSVMPYRGLEHADTHAVQAAIAWLETHEAKP